jgi:hypothetical protein
MKPQMYNNQPDERQSCPEVDFSPFMARQAPLGERSASSQSVVPPTAPTSTGWKPKLRNETAESKEKEIEKEQGVENGIEISTSPHKNIPSFSVAQVG